MFTCYLILHIVVSLAVSFNCTKSDISPHDRERQKEEKAKKKRREKAIKKYRRDNKEMYKSINKKKSQLETDLKKCPKESGGLCSIAQRIWEYINFMRSDYRKLLCEEFCYSNLKEYGKEEKGNTIMQKVRNGDCNDESNFDRAEKASGDIYMPIVKKAMEKCLKHCEDPEKLEIYVSAHEEKLKYIVSGPKWSDEFQFGYYRTSYPLDVNYENVPPPNEFWKKVEEMKEEDIRENWGGYDEVVKAYQDGYRLMRKKAGNPLTKEMEVEIERRWKEDRERSLAEWRKKDEERKEKEKEEQERKKKAELAEKNGKDGAVAKSGEDKKEKSKVSQSKKIETSKEMSKEKVDEDVKKSNKSKGAETEKNKGSKEDEEKEESDKKKDEGSKEKGSKMSKESTSKKPSAEEAK